MFPELMLEQLFKWVLVVTQERSFNKVKYRWKTAAKKQSAVETLETLTVARILGPN